MRLTILMAVLILAAAVHIAAGQLTDPCITTDRRIDLQAGTPPIEGILTKRLEDHFYRLEGIKPGQRVTVEVELRSNTSTAISLLLLREAQPRNFARIAGEQIIVGRELQNMSFSWIESSLGEGRPALCFKVGQFSEARPVTSSYRLMVSLEDVSDFRGGDAPDKPEKAVDIGEIGPGQQITISGYLSSSTGGNDHVDYYIFSASLSKGDEIVVDMTASPDSSTLEATILDRDIFGLKSNRTVNGRAELRLPWEKTESQAFYLKFSNNGGVGGEARYTATITVKRTSPSTTTQTTMAEQPTIEPTTARMIVFGGVTLIAAVSVLALVMRLREPRVREITYDEWQV